MENNNSAKIAFFYLLSSAALIFMALASGMIIFQIINKYIPDIINQYSGNYSDGTMKFGISALIVTAPIFYYAMIWIQKNLYLGNIKKDSEIRKWLTYFVMLVASAVMVGWLIGTLVSFMNGELTGKFILKSLTALAISASIFSFYLYDIKRDAIEGNKDSVMKIFLFASLSVVVAVFVSALFVVESPTETRNRKIDEQVLRDFSSIKNGLNEYYNINKKLPDNLEELKEEINYLSADNFVNPRTKKDYEYKLLSNQEFELCSDFLTSNIDENSNDSRYSPFFTWKHEKGYQCIEQKINNDLKR